MCASFNSRKTVVYAYSEINLALGDCIDLRYSQCTTTHPLRLHD